MMFILMVLKKVFVLYLINPVFAPIIIPIVSIMTIIKYITNPSCHALAILFASFLSSLNRFSMSLGFEIRGKDRKIFGHCNKPPFFVGGYPSCLL